MDKTLTIGVLTPPTARSPIGERVLAGIRSLGAQIDHAELPPGHAPAVQHAERLLAHGGADILVGVLHAGLTAEVAEICQRHGRLLIAISLGENIARYPELHPYCFQITLGLWQGQWALGSWAAQKLGRRCASVLDFYHSGYDACAAFQTAFAQAGGSAQGTLLVHTPTGGWDADQARRMIASASPDMIYAGLRGGAARDFLRFYAEEELSIPLVGTPSLALAARSLGIAAATAAGWPAECEPWAALGQQAAQLVTIGMAAADGDPQQIQQIGLAMAEARWEGPLGQARMEPRTQCAEPPLLLWAGNDAHQRLAGPAEVSAALAELRDGPRSGWLDSYESFEN
ncbi:ABC transporter substrate-binding protein [Chloroflexia bacterium SDU3-3]|nr:ABC transporter substrate-binding protein [Chloroflexia bacterium SDU3-3]